MEDRSSTRHARLGSSGSTCAAPVALEYDPGPHKPHVATLKAPEIAEEHTIRAWRGQLAARDKSLRGSLGSQRSQGRQRNTRDSHVIGRGRDSNSSKAKVISGPGCPKHC